MKKKLWICMLLGLTLLTGCGRQTETTASNASADSSIAPAADAETPAVDNNISYCDYALSGQSTDHLREF